MHPHESHTSAARQRAPTEHSKGVTQFLADTRHSSPRFKSLWGAGGCLENAVKIPRWERFLKAALTKGWRGRDEVDGGR